MASEAIAEAGSEARVVGSEAEKDRVLGVQPPPVIASGLPLTYPDPPLWCLQRALAQPSYVRSYPREAGYFVLPALPSNAAQGHKEHSSWIA
jgi:hypothetical protein